MKNEGNSYYGARSQLQHTEIWEKIDHGLLRYTKAGKKVHDVIHEKSFFRFIWQYDDININLKGKSNIKSHLHFPLFQNIEKKLGVTGHSEELWPIEGSHVFCNICTQKRIDARADFQL